MKRGFFALFYSLAVCATDVKYVKDGNSVELECPGSPVQYWQNVETKLVIAICNGNGNNVHENVSSKMFVTTRCTLGIHNVSSKEATQYQCITSSNTYKINLQLSVPPSNLRIEESNEKHEIYGDIGQLITITCHVNSGVPNETIRWTQGYDGKTLISGGPSVLKYTFRVTLSDDLRKMICSANNTIDGDLITQEALFRILRKPNVSVEVVPRYIVREGRTVTLTCKVESHGMLERLYWKHNSIRLPEESNTLVIRSVMVSQAGEYICIATNKAGQGYSKVTLSVIYSPRLRDEKLTIIGHIKKREIICHPKGIPDTYVFGEWIHTSFLGTHLRYLNGSINGTLSLPYDGDDPRYHDSGIYICNVSNNVPDDNGIFWQRGRINVTIKGKPELAQPRDAAVQFGVFNSTSNISIGLLSSTKVSHETWLDERAKMVQMENSCTLAEISSTFFKTDYKVLGYKCYLTINNTQRESFQNYTVEVCNEVGCNTFVIALRSASRPMKPEIINGMSGTNYISISWRPAFDGGYNQSFVVEYRKRLDNLWMNITVNKDGEEIQISYLYDLEADSEYEIRLFAFNKIGRSDETIANFMTNKEKGTDVSVVYGIVRIMICISVLILALKCLIMRVKEGVLKYK